MEVTGRLRNQWTWGPKEAEQKNTGQWLEGVLEAEVVEDAVTGNEEPELGRCVLRQRGQDP